MVKPVFENLNIDFWVHPGRLGTTKPSVCLFHDELQIGAPILEALIELQAQASRGQRTLTFTACSRKRAIRKLKLLLVPAREELRVMNIRRDAETATFEMTADGIALVAGAFAAWLAGAEDFCVSQDDANLKPKQLGALDKDSGELWFWGPVHTVQ